MPSLILGGVGLATQLFSGAQQAYLGHQQRKQAAALQLQDHTPPALTEALGLARQEAASGRMPGMSQQEERIAQQTGNVSQGAVRAGASSAQIQAALAGADARGQSALADLGVRAQQYRDQAKQRLTGVLAQKAQQSRADYQDFSREKAALLEGATRNTFNAGQSVSNGMAGAASILASAGVFDKLGKGGAGSGAAAALAAGRTGTGYSAIGAPAYDPFQYGRY